MQTVTVMWLSHGQIVRIQQCCKPTDVGQLPSKSRMLCAYSRPTWRLQNEHCTNTWRWLAGIYIQFSQFNTQNNYTRCVSITSHTAGANVFYIQVDLSVQLTVHLTTHNWHGGKAACILIFILSSSVWQMALIIRGSSHVKPIPLQTWTGP
jgi:hypothetical protein